MSNLFEIAAQALKPIPPSSLNSAILAPRAGPKPKPLAARQSLHALQPPACMPGPYYDYYCRRPISSVQS